MSNPTHPLIQRIAALRRRARRLISLQGLAFTLAAPLGALLVLILLDYWLHFPGWMRLVLGIIFVPIWIGGIYRYWVRPLSTTLTDQFLAGRVERVQKPLADELISALAFIRQGLPEQNQLAAQAVEKVNSLAANLSFDKALQYRTITRSWLSALSLGLVLAIGYAVAPNHWHTGVIRWFDPLAYHAWPQNTVVELVWPGGTTPEVLPIGEPITIRAVVKKGYSERLRVFLNTNIDRQKQQRELMNYQEGPSDPKANRYIYEKRLEPVGESDLALQVLAGDDNEQNYLHIRLAPRPEIAALKAGIRPPHYIAIPATTRNSNLLKDKTNAGSGERNFDLLTETARAIEGAQIHLVVHASKPIQVNQGQPFVRLLDPTRDQLLAMKFTTQISDPQTAVISFSAQESLEFRIQIRDTDGFDNRVGGTVRIDVVPDALPTVVIAEPRRPLEVIPEAIIPVEIQANDDMGLTQIFLRADNYDVQANSPPRFQRELPWTSLNTDSATLNVTGTVKHQWNLSELEVKPSERITFTTMVRDNFLLKASDFGAHQIKDPFETGPDLDGKTIQHRLVKSAPLSLLIVTKERVEEIARKDLQDIRDQLRSLIEQQQVTNQQTRAIQKAVTAAQRITSQQRQQLAELVGQQAAQAQRALGMQNRAEQVGQNLAINQMTDSELGKLASDTQKDLQQAGQNDMTKAANQLSQAQDTNQANEAKNAAQAAEATQQAAQAQEQALQTMRQAVDRLGAAGDLEAHRAQISKLLEQQKQLENQLREQAAKTLGKPLDQLTAEERAALERMAQAQEKMAGETAKLTAAMEKSAEQLAKKDPASSESLNRAVQASRDNNVAGNQSSAAQSVGNNQMASAAGDMTTARKGLEAMKEELDQQNRRQLEQLARQLQELLDSIQKIREMQDTLHTETLKLEKSSPPATREQLEPMGNRESRLQGNTLAETQRAESLKDGHPIAQDLHDAADAMGGATAELLKTKVTSALPPEKDALAALDKAIEKLKKKKKEVEEQLKQEDLATFRQQYETIRDQQKLLLTDTQAMAKRLQNREPERSDLASLGKLANKQGALRDQVKQLSTRKELSEYEVLVWINQQIIENMSEAQSHLSKAKVDPALVAAQTTALDRIQDIIDSLKEEQQKKDNNFASGGQGGGQGGKAPLIPPSAQLKLLKTQQMIINRNTAELQLQLERAGSATQKQEIQDAAQRLGEKQDKIKELATKVISKLNQP